MADQPSKLDITAVFKRLKSIPANKQCFDCGSNNPTWASVTYGVFLCIDCSAVHRSLGVHVTFIRSTQLDTNWTWLQLRAMQVGGNGNALSFFRQHGCTTNDAQQKYHSRAASLYREKLLSQAHSVMKLHGTKLHLDINTTTEATGQVKEVDFFEEHSENFDTNDNSSTATTNGLSDSAKLYSDPQPINNGNTQNVSSLQTADPNEGPSVEAALSISPTQVQNEPRKSILGSKRPGAAKKGKGLGAQRVKTNFNEIESRAQQLDKEREDLEALHRVNYVKSQDEGKQMASMRLAYQDLSLERKKKEDKLKITDPKKAEQLERLGMGFSGHRGISHSVLSDMTVIDQEAPSGQSNNSTSLDRFDAPSRSSHDFFEDELDKLGRFPSLNSSSSSKWGFSNKTGSWDVDRFESKTSFTDSMPSFDESDKPSRNRKTFEIDTSTNAQDKFGNAKSISSEQFFGPKDPDLETKQTLSKFEGSSSISSDDFFGGGPRSSHGSSHYSGTDLSDIKEGVRQGVTKVAGKLSSLANGVMSSLQEKYGS